MRFTYNGSMHISSERISSAGVQTGIVFWGPAWVDGMLGRLVLMADSTTLAERWGVDGWSPDDLPTVDDLLRWGIPATEDSLKELDVVLDPSGLAVHTSAGARTPCGRHGQA